ncbi:MAG: ATP phosphoribosyltransferase regulatory subunit, partial [Flavobacteriales bacterium]|nr:ATP phosphoribosyltransferase regulatory subunit [Flavobacteriales bacterium]
MAKPSVPKGTRDFLPDQVRKRNHIFKKCQEAFELHGFSPIETPAMEKLETLTGKYGEEGDQLLFKVANRSDKLAHAVEQVINMPADSRKPSALSNALCDQALRYDLTVPFARFVVQHQNDL